jgi:hypothetical protein
LDGGFALGDHGHHRSIEKSVQDPDEDHKIDEFEYKRCPIQFHGSPFTVPA